MNNLKEYLPYIVLFLMIFAYAFTLSILSINNHNRFLTPGYDLGIYDQGIWLLSQGKTPFVTVRGLHLFGDHMTFINILTAPIFWVWDNVRALLIFQSVFVALGAIPIYLIARDAFKNNYLPLMFVFAYLLFPSLHYANLYHYHPDTLATTLLLFSFYFLTKKNYILYWIFIGLSLITKEEIALTIFAIGLYATVFHNKKVGIMTSLIAIIWLVLVFEVFYSYFNEVGYFYGFTVYAVFGELGSSPIEVIKTLITKPGIGFKILFTDVNKEYIFNLMSPINFLSILHLPTFFISLPALLMNLLSGWSYRHLINYHYTSAIIPFLFISMIYGISRLKRKEFKTIAIILLILATIMGNYYIAPFSTSHRNLQYTIGTFSNFNKILSDREQSITTAINMIPDDASVTATPFFIPHLTHREIIYEFPNPFITSYWGIEDKNPPPKDVEYILVDVNEISGEGKSLLSSLIETGQYIKIFDRYRVWLLVRTF